MRIQTTYNIGDYVTPDYKHEPFKIDSIEVCYGYTDADGDTTYYFQEELEPLETKAEILKEKILHRFPAASLSQDELLELIQSVYGDE